MKSMSESMLRGGTAKKKKKKKKKTKSYDGDSHEYLKRKSTRRWLKGKGFNAMVWGGCGCWT